MNRDPDPPDDWLICRRCGQPLLGDPDDRPATPAGPECGECHRIREFEHTMWEAEWFGE